MTTSNDFLAELSALGEKKNQEIDPEKEIFLFGAGKFAQELCLILKNKNFPVSGFVETTPSTIKVQGFPVFNIGEFARKSANTQLLLGVFNRKHALSKIVNSLKSHAVQSDLFMPWDIYRQFGNDLGWKYWLESNTFIRENISRVKETLSLFSDEASRTAFKQLCLFRSGLNLSYSEYTDADQQYFNSVTLPHLTNREINYIDCGAYDGNSLFELMSFSKEFMFSCKAFLFEPDFYNYRKMLSELNKHPIDAYCIPLGVGDSYSSIGFMSGDGEAATLSAKSDTHISTCSLDEFFSGSKIDFIKLDVEGNEVPALAGARQLIKAHRPILAISAYHRPSDIFDIPEFINNMNCEYKIYFRQHYYNSFDCVIYAIPAK